MRASQIALISAGAAVTGVLGYAVYFDYMRRNSPEFRKGLRKQQKKLKAVAETQAKEQAVRDQRELTLALVELELEVPPSSPEQMEAYFQEHVATAEGLAAQGPENYVKSATHFYRALRVYPQPVELLMIYQKVCPEPVFQLVLKLTQLTSAVNAGGASSVRQAAGLDAAASVEDVDDSAPAGSEKKAEEKAEEKEDDDEEDEEEEEEEGEKKEETAAEHIEETLEIAEEAAVALEKDEKSSNEGSGASWDHVSNEQ